MDDIVNQLVIHLASDPSDWDRRLELAERYFSYGAHREIAELFRQAPNPPSSQSQTHRVVELTAGGDLSGLNGVLSSFAAANGQNAWAHHVYARILAHQQRLEEARVEYDLAVALDISKKDTELEALLGIPDAPEEVKVKVQPVPEAPSEEFVGKTFMVALGEAVKPKEKEPDVREKSGL